MAGIFDLILYGAQPVVPVENVYRRNDDAVERPKTPDKKTSRKRKMPIDHEIVSKQPKSA